MPCKKSLLFFFLCFSFFFFPAASVAAYDTGGNPLSTGRDAESDKELGELESSSSSTNLMYNRGKPLKKRGGGPYGPSDGASKELESSSSSTNLMYNRGEPVKKREGGPYGPSSKGATPSDSQAQGSVGGRSEETESNPSSPRRGPSMFPVGEVNQFRKNSRPDTSTAGIISENPIFPGVDSKEIEQFKEINKESTEQEKRVEEPDDRIDSPEPSASEVTSGDLRYPGVDPREVQEFVEINQGDTEQEERVTEKGLEEESDQVASETETQGEESDRKKLDKKQSDAKEGGNPCSDTDDFPDEIDDLSKSKLNDLIGELENFKSNFMTSRSTVKNGVTTVHDADPIQANICQRKIRRYEKALGDLKKCTEAIKEMKEEKADFVRDCGEFSSGRMQCSVAIMACKMCPSQAAFGHYDCVKVHGNTVCPAKSGEELKTAERKREKVQEEIEDLREGVADLEQNIASKEVSLNDSLSDLEGSFIDITNELERGAEEQRAEVNNQLKNATAQIREVVEKAVAEVQKEIDNSLAVAHSFENAITKANMEYRKERRQIVLECETQARGRLAQYRQKRRAAIRTGSLQISMSSLLRRGRMSFAQIEAALFRQYNAECLSKRKEDFKMVEREYKQKLRLIEQQREQYQARLESLKNQIASLHRKAYEQRNELLKEYAKNMDGILKSYEKEYRLVNQKYLRNKNKLLAETSKIAVLQKQLVEHRTLSEEKDMELVREEEMIAYLRSKGVSEEDAERQYSKAASSFVEYYDAIEQAAASCSEDNQEIRTARGHIERDSSRHMLESFFGGGEGRR